MAARFATVLLAVALVASVTEWVLTFSAGRTPAQPLAVLPAGDLEPQASLDVAPIARLLGASSGAETGAIRALGVMAEGKSGSRGIALIAVEGKPTRSYRTGDLVAPGVVLKEVRKDGVVLSRSGALQELRLPTKPTPVVPPIQR